MALLTHILIAFASLGYSAYLFFFPSREGLNVSYILTGLTLTSGTFLIVSTGSHMLEACVMGLLYLALTIFGIVSAKHKLAEEIIDSSKRRR